MAVGTDDLGQEVIFKHTRDSEEEYEFQQYTEVDSETDKLISGILRNYKNCIDDGFLKRILDPEDTFPELDT